MMKNLFKKIIITGLFVSILVIGAGSAHAQGLNIESIEDFSINNNFNEIITEQDWNTLSEQAIDQKLIAAGQESIFDANNPFYTLSILEIELLSSTEFEAVAGDYFGDTLVFEDEFDPEFVTYGEGQDLSAVISDRDWATLSEQSIDQKLIAAGYLPIFDQNNPFYTMSINELKDLSEDEYTQIADAYYGA